MQGAVFLETINPHFQLQVSLRSLFYNGRSAQQELAVMDSHHFGRMLVLDGHMQSTENDEFIYHECLVHPAMLCFNQRTEDRVASRPSAGITSQQARSDGAGADATGATASISAVPRTVFVAGGGEGATVREILKYPGVEKVVMVDIDGDAVRLCREHLPKHSAGAFEDPRLELVIDDALAWLERSRAKFDLYVGDLCDPVEGSPAKLLYTKRYFQMVREHLNPGGLLVTQAGPAGVLTHSQVYTAIHRTLAEVFGPAHTFAYKVPIPSFVDEWGFVVASTDTQFNPVRMDQSMLANRLLSRLGASNSSSGSGISSSSSSSSGSSATSSSSNSSSSSSSNSSSSSSSSGSGSSHDSSSSSSSSSNHPQRALPLQFYDEVTHSGLFVLNRKVRETLQSENRIITEEEPLVIP